MSDTETIAEVIAAVVRVATTTLVTDVKVLQNHIGVWEMRWSDLASLRERVALVEARAPIPGPPGPQGEPGKDGARGGDGYTGATGPPGADGRIPPELQERIAALEARFAAPSQDIPLEDLAPSLIAAVQAELATIAGMQLRGGST